ncbi:MAG TPA: hypothetical protein VFJ16_19595, partial [Longimicrobium sp.]|nr:hypothetical protein [Longimicrobium sp.]
MPQLLSEYFEIDSDELSRLGVHDTFVDLDSRLHVDPHLLPGSSVPEMQEAEAVVKSYFEDIIILLEEATGESDICYEAAKRKLTLSELKGVSLGYSKGEGDGSAVGPGLAAALTNRAYRIVKGGERNPRIFELMGLFTDAFGPDRISDVVIRIAAESFAKYTARVAAELGIQTKPHRIGEGIYNLPTSIRRRKDHPLFFVPQDVLDELPVALNRSEIYYAARYNAQVRAALNKLFATVGKNHAKPSKTTVWERAAEKPALLQALLAAYERAKARPYDFRVDPAAEGGRIREARDLAKENPLDLSQPKAGWTGPLALETVTAICLHFKKLVEINGLWASLWISRGKPLKETSIQRIFYSVAVTYCRTGKPDLDISPEVNAGPGPVDFKFSHGANIKVTVEMKKSNHGKLLHGYSTQLARYNEAENTDLSIYL